MGCRVTLGDICSFDRGASIPRTRMLNSGDLLYIHYGDLYKGFDLRIDVEKPAKPLPFISADEKIKDSQRLNDQDIVYVLTSETVDDLGHAYLFNNPSGKSAVSGTETTIVRVERKDVVLPAYLNYLMSSPRFISELRQYTRGMKVFRVHPSDVARIEVDLPSIDEQRKVVAILDAIYEKQQTNTKLNGYLADAVDGLFEKALGQSEEKTLTDVVEILSGGTPKTKISEYWEDGEIPFFGPGDANGSTYCLTTAKHITQLGLENCNSELYPVDTVFLTARGTVGKVAMAGKPMAMNQSCFAFRGLGVSQPAVYQIIKRAVRSLKVKANGATFAAINTRDLKIEAILVPSDEELTAFEEEAASLHSMMRVNEEESLKLSSLRDALLSKLIAGEIDVSKVDLTQINSHLA